MHSVYLQLYKLVLSCLGKSTSITGIRRHGTRENFFFVSDLRSSLIPTYCYTSPRSVLLLLSSTPGAFAAFDEYTGKVG